MASDSRLVNRLLRCRGSEVLGTYRSHHDQIGGRIALSELLIVTVHGLIRNIMHVFVVVLSSLSNAFNLRTWFPEISLGETKLDWPITVSLV